MANQSTANTATQIDFGFCYQNILFFTILPAQKRDFTATERVCSPLSSEDKLRRKGSAEGSGHLVSRWINTKVLGLSEGEAQAPMLILFMCLGRVLF